MDYRKENRWYITASKLKLFMDSPLLYKAVYIDEVDLTDVKKSAALEIWSMVDKFLLTPSEFEKEYVFPVWSLKAELVSYCEEHWIQLDWKEKVEDLKNLIYWDKKVLTDAQSAIVEWISNEVSRQPLRDKDTKYEAQKDLYWIYKDLKIKWTLDRFYIDEDNNVTIRDLKTTSQMYFNSYAWNTQFYSELSTKDPFHYKLQMAMYVWLVKQNYKDVKSISVIIDAVWTTEPYFYQAIKLDTEELEKLWDDLVVPLLESVSLIEAWMEMVVDTTDRNKLCSNWYYRLWTEDCIQKDYEYIVPVNNWKIPLTTEQSDFDRDAL